MRSRHDLFFPAEAPLEEGEVCVEEESGEDSAELKHATDTAPPSSGEVENIE